MACHSETVLFDAPQTESLTLSLSLSLSLSFCPFHSLSLSRSLSPISPSVHGTAFPQLVLGGFIGGFLGGRRERSHSRRWCHGRRRKITCGVAREAKAEELCLPGSARRIAGTRSFAEAGGGTRTGTGSTGAQDGEAQAAGVRSADLGVSLVRRLAAAAVNACRCCCEAPNRPRSSQECRGQDYLVPRIMPYVRIFLRARHQCTVAGGALRLDRGPQGRRRGHGQAAPPRDHGPPEAHLPAGQGVYGLRRRRAQQASLVVHSPPPRPIPSVVVTAVDGYVRFVSKPICWEYVRSSQAPRALSVLLFIVGPVPIKPNTLVGVLYCVATASSFFSVPAALFTLRGPVEDPTRSDRQSFFFFFAAHLRL